MKESEKKDLNERRTLLVVHAHPDDEGFSTGGTLSRYADEGVRTVLVTCTGGEAGPISDAKLAKRENLATVRADELAEAARILGIHRTIPLGYRDSGMAGTPENEHPDSFHRADLEEATGRLVRLIREERPQVIIAPNEHGDYGHPDHVKANRIAVAAFEAAGDANRFPGTETPWQPSKLYFTAIPRSGIEKWAEAMRRAGIESPFAERTFQDVDGRPVELWTRDELVTTKIDVQSQAAKKHQALLAHRTQFGADHFIRRVPPEAFAGLWTHEHFRLVRGSTSARDGEREVDLFAG